MGERRAGLRRNQLQRRVRGCHRRRPAVTEKKSPEESRHTLVLRAQAQGGGLRGVVSTDFAL